MDIKKEWAKRKIFYIVMALIFFIWLFFVIKSRYYNQIQIDKHGISTTAEIIESGTYGRGQPFTRYRYEVDGNIYEASISKWLNECPGKTHCVGAKFKLVYSDQDPNIHELQIEEQLNDSTPLGIRIQR